MTTLHDTALRGFASDNYSGIHPEVLAAIATANDGHQVAYGEDDYTARLQEVFAQHFGEGVEAFPVFNGTGANVVGLQSMLPRWGAVIAASTAHINVDEGGAPERVAGIKLLTVPTDDGKLTPELIDREAWGWGDEHRAQPLVVSVTQSTELGTLYSVDELRAIADHVHALGMQLHMDGARISNAAASLGLPLRDFTRDVGVDVLSFGGTKNGAMLGEAIVVLEPRGIRRTHVPAQAQHAAVVEDAVRLGAADRAARGRPVAAQRVALQRDGRSACARASKRASPTGRSRRRVHAADAVERRLRDPAGRRRRPAARVLPLLRLGCREERGALDVLVRHDRGRHRRVHRRDRPRDLGLVTFRRAECTASPRVHDVPARAIRAVDGMPCTRVQLSSRRARAQALHRMRRTRSRGGSGRSPRP